MCYDPVFLEQEYLMVEATEKLIRMLEDRIKRQRETLSDSEAQLVAAREMLEKQKAVKK